MRKKLNIQLIGIAIFSMLITILFTSVFQYKLYQQQVFDELDTAAHIFSSVKYFSDYSISEHTTEYDNIRISYIDPSGTVLSDTGANPENMDNHAERPEISDAMATGEGHAIRKSDTLAVNNFYYAMKLDTGYILRVSTEARSIFSVMASSVPSILVISVSLTIGCTIIAHMLTKSMMKPIENIANNIDRMDEIETYKELEPFIETIHRQHEDILKSAKIRQEFTANVSHELKTPLTAISGYSELIENGMANEEDTLRFAKEIHRNASRLLTLINDIIRLSELDTGEQNIPTEEINLYELADDCISMLQINADKHDVTVALSGKRTIIKENRQMLEEILYNLCDNGIRYNKPGGKVEVSVNENETEVILTVSDNGIGISEENQKRIFERFYRVDKSHSKETGGTGLGLAIVKHIVEQINATLTLESTLEVGTTISIHFPKAI